MLKKKQNSGVSMVSLVITIIVIIILAAVAFTGSQETIGRAGFSGFVTDIDSVRTAFITEGIPSLVGQESSKNNDVTKAQAYNYLAKGATELAGESARLAWLTKAQANAIQCTRIEPETAKDAIGIELPKRTVNTYAGTKIPMSYFVTNKGDIFVWPPFLRSDDGLYYVNDTTTLASSSTEEQIFTGTVTIVFDSGAVVVVDSSASKLEIAETTLERIENNGIASIPGIYYKDERNAEQPDGIESTKILQNTSPTLSTTEGFDTKDNSTGSDGTATGGGTGENPGEGETPGEGGEEPSVPAGSTAAELGIEIGDSVTYKNAAGNSVTLYVLDIEGTSTLKLTTRGTTGTESKTLTRLDGFYNGVSELNSMCDTKYANSSKGITAKSITVEDINKLGNVPSSVTGVKETYYFYSKDYPAADIPASAGNTYHIVHRTDYSTSIISDWAEPRFYINNSHSDTNDIRITGGELKDGSTARPYRVPTEDSPVKVEKTYYTYSVNTYVTNSQQQSLLSGNYWLASPFVISYSSHAYASFGMRYVNSGSVYGYGMFNSNGYPGSSGYAVRPLVSLSSGLIDKTASSDGAWVIN